MSTTFCETGIVRSRVDIVQRYFEIRLCSLFNFIFSNVYFGYFLRNFDPPPTVTVSNALHDIDRSIILGDWGEGANKIAFNYISGSNHKKKTPTRLDP